MTGPARLLLLVELGLIAFLLARAAARGRALPHQHGWYALAWTVLPPLCLIALWSIMAPGLIAHAVLADAPALPLAPFARAATLARARAGYGPPALTTAFAQAQEAADWLATALILATAAAGFAWSCRRSRSVVPRAANEGLIVTLLAGASLVLVLAAAGIVVTLLWESLHFFERVPTTAFLFGTHWSLQGIDTHPATSLGALPLLWGTFFIGVVIAMAVAVPVGLLSAIWLAHYAPPGARRWVRPTLEILAGLPSIVYGWWAILSVAPAIRALGSSLGSTEASGESALAAGLVMGVLAIPYVASAADDAFTGLASELRDGSLALGATTAETVVHILLPAALPGIAGGVLLAIARTVGETVIAVLVASAAANVSLDPFAPATTVTRQIVDLMTGEATFDSPGPLAAFALGLLLFAATLLLNLVALRIVRRARLAHE